VVIFVVFGILMVFSTFLKGDVFFKIVHDQFQIPASFVEFLSRPWTIFTYAFMHNLRDIWHIVFNMLVLYWFGRLFVEYLGSDKLIAVYVLGAFSGAIAFLLAYNTIPVFVEQVAAHGGGMVGASASVLAVSVATATLLPNYTFHLLLLGPVRIKYIVMVIVFLSFLGTVGSNAGGNFAHLGGALIGFIYIRQLQAGVNWGAWITATLDWIKGLFESKPKVKVSYRKADEPKTKSSATNKVKASQEEIDAILDKISDHGYDSLSKTEKEKLFNASKK
jgi:membrane associated rhomboid family serine protease